jgi:hypothetical protein
MTLPRRAGAGVAFQQHHPGGGHVQRQPQQRGHQQHGGKGGEVQRLDHVRGHQHHHQRHGDVEGEEQVQHEGRQRQHHHRQHHDDEQRRHQRTCHAGARADQFLQLLYEAVHLGHDEGGGFSGRAPTRERRPGTSWCPLRRRT